MSLNAKQEVYRLLKVDPRTRTDDYYLLEQILRENADKLSIPQSHINVTMSVLRAFQKAGLNVKSVFRDRAYIQRHHPEFKDEKMAQKRKDLEGHCREKYSPKNQMKKTEVI